jgi:hypothetical protein
MESFDASGSLFQIRGVPADRLLDYLDAPLTDDLLETAVRLESLEAWTPFVKEERVFYHIKNAKTGPGV